MTDEEVEQLKAELAAGKRLAWFDSGTAREIVRVVPCIESEGEEEAEPGPCGILTDGTWIALDNVSPDAIFSIATVFPPPTSPINSAFSRREIEQALFQINGYFSPSPHEDMKIRGGDTTAIVAEFRRSRDVVLQWLRRSVACVEAMTVTNYLQQYPRTNRDLYDESVPLEQ